MNQVKDLEGLADRLTLKKKSIWESTDQGERKKIFDFAEDYKEFLDKSKTERETVDYLVESAKKSGFVNLDELWDDGDLPQGAKFYKSYHGKAAILGVMGKEDLSRGFRLVGSHVDVPRLDLKPRPLYEKSHLALLKTHYYGGIKKYQWAAIPLALHGVVFLKDGERVEIIIGEQDRDPVFTVTDLLPHLAKEQNERKLREGIKGEELNILVGNTPMEGEGFKEKIKLWILNHLNEAYGMIEEDFVSAEIEIVPAIKARDVGFDRSMVGGYGQDDRICVYASLKAVEGLELPERTAMAAFFDKEEIGSTGNTGMQSRLLDDVVSTLKDLSGIETPQSRIYSKSEALSADVAAGMDPTWEDVMDPLNAPHLGFGVCLIKYTGARGKVETNDAHAEFISKVRSLLNENNIIWQWGELGKVDEGGGGTIAQFLAGLNINTVDCGMPLLSMHSPFEISSKGDLFMGYRAYRAFLQ
ncbi:MAG: aminopeptidase [Clostridia bacterium]|nr:aminopeptidase [Clostridia bacterium]